MPTKLTPQQIAAANAKRMATMQANRAAGKPTVRQMRAAAKAAKAAAQGQTVPPPSSSSYQSTQTPPPNTGFRPGFRPRRTRRVRHTYVPPAQNIPPQAPVFSTPKPTYRALKLAALAQLEEAFKQKLAEQGITDDARNGWATYKKLKALALGTTTNQAMQNEADTALRMATIALIKLTY